MFNDCVKKIKDFVLETTASVTYICCQCHGLLYINMHVVNHIDLYVKELCLTHIAHFYIYHIHSLHIIHLSVNSWVSWWTIYLKTYLRK